MNRVSVRKEQLSYGMDEEMKTLRTNIQFAGKDKKVILITSCLSGEGKSQTAFRLAKSFTEIGKKVLMIDTDMRKSVLLRVVEGEAPAKGLSHYLSGQCNLADVVCATDVPRLHMLFAGPVPPNPAELLSGDLFKSTVDSFRNIYDYIVVDSAPLGMLVDAAIIGEVCDASILLLESGNVKYKFAQEVKEKLENAHRPVLGAVLNKVDRAKTGKYYGKYYKKYYGTKYN